MNPEIIGYIAGALTAAALIPQLVRSYRTKSTRDISMLWTSIYLLGLILWITYGVMIMSYPLFTISSVEALFAVFLLAMKIKYD